MSRCLLFRRLPSQILAALLVGVLSAWSAGALAAERRMALVIGNSAYASLAQLPAAVEDARQVGAKLRSLGYDVAHHENLNERSMWRALKQFSRELLPEDTALIYFAGRVVQLGAGLYLAPIDADPNAARASRALLAREAYLGLERSMARHGLLALDAVSDAATRELPKLAGGSAKTAILVAPPRRAAERERTFGPAFSAALSGSNLAVTSVARRLAATLADPDVRIAIPEDFQLAPTQSVLLDLIRGGSTSGSASGGVGGMIGGVVGQVDIGTRDQTATARGTSNATRRASRAEDVAAVDPPSRAVPIDRGGDLPPFPWPPPKPSAFSVIPRSLATGGSEPVLLGDIARRIEGALFQARYAERTYRAAPGGFALTTRLERIFDDGRPDMDRRWFGGEDSGAFSLTRYIRALFLGDPGRYRFLVFLVTDRDFAATGDAIGAEAAEDMLRTGAMTLPRRLANQPFSDDHDVTVLVYEFKRPEGGDPSFVQPSPLDGIIHLRSARLLQALEGG